MSEPVRLCRESGRPGYFLCEDGEDAELLALPRAEFEAMRDALREAAEWAHRIAHDERVTGWVHANDYGLYCLLADPPAALTPPPQPEV